MASKDYRPDQTSRTGVALTLAFALACLLAAATPVQGAPGQEFKVAESAVALRAQPRDTANAILMLTPEHRLVEFERRGDWVRVGVFRVVGAFGWVPAADLVALPRAVAPAETTAAAPPEAGAGTDVGRFLLEISGTPAVHFGGRCSLVDAAGQIHSVEVSGRIPKAFRFRASAVSCELRKRDFMGRLRLRLQDRDQVVAQRTTSGPFNKLRVRSAGPWGPAQAVGRGGLVFDDSGLGEPRIRPDAPTRGAVTLGN